ncbi:hypothetical protein BT69DRAFT_1282775 [Atractiella rhizophila]|nr:hypothetical protein BT69DRAFT_1282709 [Atractiella rhizophila]KAH8921967.1 hypothetical protein BT69DRAFT_1282775 [Atractiella rhizophila]
MFQHQEYNKEVMIMKFNSIDRRIMELLRLLNAGNNASGSGGSSGVDSAGRAERRLLRRRR